MRSIVTLTFATFNFFFLTMLTYYFFSNKNTKILKVVLFLKNIYTLEEQTKHLKNAGIMRPYEKFLDH